MLSARDQQISAMIDEGRRLRALVAALDERILELEALLEEERHQHAMTKIRKEE